MLVQRHHEWDMIWSIALTHSHGLDNCIQSNLAKAYNLLLRIDSSLSTTLLPQIHTILLFWPLSFLSSRTTCLDCRPWSDSIGNMAKILQEWLYRHDWATALLRLGRLWNVRNEELKHLPFPIRLCVRRIPFVTDICTRNNRCIFLKHCHPLSKRFHVLLYSDRALLCQLNILPARSAGELMSTGHCNVGG